MAQANLFTLLRLGALPRKHRLVMTPLTRMRAKQPGDVPHELNAEYYGQRASDGGLQISEVTDITPQAHGYPWVPGIYSDDQIAGWRLATDAVHARGASSSIRFGMSATSCIRRCSQEARCRSRHRRS